MSVVDLKTNKIAVNGEWTELPKVDTAFFNNNQGYEIFGENLIAYRQSGQIPIAYAAVEPAAALNAAIQKIVILSAGLLIVCIILCFILIGLGIWRSYNPLRQLLALVNSDSGRKGIFAGSYSEIRSVILEAMEQKMAYENLYKEKNSLEKRQLFCAMLESKKAVKKSCKKVLMISVCILRKDLTVLYICVLLILQLIFPSMTEKTAMSFRCVFVRRF